MLGRTREKGLAFVLVTHDAALAARCDRVVRMQAGQLLAAPTPAETV
jgi:lipoprotein-releasing system ATP-binding protein